MAIAVIAGLTFATFLTLVLVPVLYDLWFARHERRRGAVVAGSGPAADEQDEEDSERLVASAMAAEDSALSS